MTQCTREITGFDIVLSGFFSSIGIWPNHHVTDDMRAEPREVLELLEAPHLAEKPVDEMSSGEARRMLIGRALVHDPQALLLDEPSTSLDLFAQHELRETVRKLARSGNRHSAGDASSCRISFRRSTASFSCARAGSSRTAPSAKC